MKTLSIVIPVYNEIATLEKIIQNIEEANIGNFKKEIVLVDDGSTDGSKEFLENLKNHKTLFHEKNRGKGAALRTGFEQATGDFVVVQDADLEYNPNDFKALLETLTKDKRKVVYGSRILEPSNRSHSSFAAYVGGRILTLITNILYGTHLTDEPTCYKMFEKNFLSELGLRCEGFEFCPEVTAKIALKKEEIIEIPIHYYPRSFQEGKKINWRDFIVAVKVLFCERFSLPYRH